jgi:hypothetical protein
VYSICYFVAQGLVAIFCITQLYVGRAAIGVGAAIAGVDLPNVPGVDAEKGEAKPAASEAEQK